MSLKTKCWRIILGESNIGNVVKIKNWIPYWAEGCLWWPTMLIDTKCKERITSTPCWNRYRFKAIFMNLLENLRGK